MFLLKKTWNALKGGWDILRTVYWYNSLAWRFLKSGALIVLGFFSLSMGNLVLSYKPDWTVLNYLIAYGFLLIIYGPIHHLVVIPVSLKLAHTSWGQTIRINKRGPFWTLISFFVVCILFGAYPLDVMTFEFKAPQLTRTRDINPDITCYRTSKEPSARIHCTVPDVEGIAYVEVENKGSTILTDREAPYEFSLAIDELEAVVGQKNFHVVLRDENDYMIRRYVRSTSMVAVETRSDTPP